MKKENKLWTKNTNIKKDDLNCPTCGIEMDIHHISPSNGIMYANCSGCGRNLNISYK